MITAWEEIARRPNPGRLTGEAVAVLLLLEFGMMGEQSECAARWQLANEMRNKNNGKEDRYAVCLYV